MSSLRSLAGLLCILLLPGRAVAQMPRLGDLVPIDVTDGLNVVADFAADRRSGTILRLRQEDGLAPRGHLFLVMLPKPAGRDGWDAVGIDEPTGRGRLRDHLLDASRTDAGMGTAIRFARGRLNGRPAILLFETRGAAGRKALAGPTPVVLDVYRLAEASAGSGPDRFEFVTETRSRTRFCDAGLALSIMTGLGMPADHAGSSRIDGCAG